MLEGWLLKDQLRNSSVSSRIFSINKLNVNINMKNSSVDRPWEDGLQPKAQLELLNRWLLQR